MRSRIEVVVLSVVVTASLLWPAQRRKKVEEVTQTLDVLPDPPSAVAAEVDRLVFHVSPLSSQGLLTRQTQDALGALRRLMDGATAVKLRAFVAGTGDMRRIQSIVSEVFTERRQPLPALSVVQVGALPMEGAQVIIESVGVAKRKVNPNGLAFISGQAATANDPLAPMTPLIDKSLSDLRAATRTAASDSAAVLRVTCFLSSIDNAADIRSRVNAVFAGAAINIVQTQRAPQSAIAECEAVVRLASRPATAVEFVNPEGLPKSPNYSQVALVAPGQVAFTGTQMAFRFQDSDVRLAFERLKKALEQVKASVSNVAMSSVYPLTPGIAERVRAIRFEFYDRARPPASTMLPFEGLPSLDGSFAVDVVAPVP